MANNRMWLRCTVCDERTLLFKYYPKMTDGWFIKNYGDPFTDGGRVGQFLEKHSYCDDNDIHIGNTSFDLVFEEGDKNE